MENLTDRDVMLRTRVAQSLAAVRRLLESDAHRTAAEAAGRVADSLAAGGKVLLFGNANPQGDL